VWSRWKPAAAPISWAREIGKLGHDVRLIPPAYVKPFVKRQKNDAADAEAICEAAQRPTMRFVAVKSKETQGAAMVMRLIGAVLFEQNYEWQTSNRYMMVEAFARIDKEEIDPILSICRATCLI
jgi:transposase